MDKTTLITGVSGGMIGASYYRELYLRKKWVRILIFRTYNTEIILEATI